MVRRVLMTKGSFCGENVDVWCFWVMAGITPVISGRGLSFSKRNYNLFNGGNDFQGIAISWLVTTEKTLVTWLIPSTERIHISPKRVGLFPSHRLKSAGWEGAYVIVPRSVFQKVGSGISWRDIFLGAKRFQSGRACQVGFIMKPLLSGASENSHDIGKSPFLTGNTSSFMVDCSIVMVVFGIKCRNHFWPDFTTA